MFYIFSRNIPLHCKKISAKVTQQKNVGCEIEFFFVHKDLFELWDI